jgi:hypothetical protein
LTDLVAVKHLNTPATFLQFGFELSRNCRLPRASQSVNHTTNPSFIPYHSDGSVSFHGGGNRDSHSLEQSRRNIQNINVSNLTSLLELTNANDGTITSSLGCMSGSGAAVSKA